MSLQVRETSHVRLNARRVRQVLDDYLRRRAAGETLGREALLAAHPDLLPALADEFDLLHLMDRAVRQARDGEAVAAGSSSPSAPRRALPGPERLAGYRIERELHRGAQGVVYLAVQESTGRRVAVKVLHAGAFGTPGDRGRFAREVDILAHLRHPNIVSILDSGVADGCCYLAMDYVEGVALDEELRARPRPVRAALKLFLTIADALAAAHARGVVHRDLKPGNILVDASGRPHVLDFGLAKAVGEPSHLTMTAEGQFLGSLPWASPEQIGASGDVDVRSDVYALGVLLFQMLTGGFPYTVVGPIPQVIEQITHAEPKRPSRLRREVGHELDTLVLKCLSKAPERRYQSAAELAADVRRLLDGEPLEAKRDSTLYVLSKHMRRHRWPVALAGSLLVALVLFAAYAATQARANRLLAERERAAREAAESASRLAGTAQAEAARERDAANAARDSETAQRRAADAEAERAQAVTAFFVRTFGVAEPDASQTGAVTLETLIDRAVPEIGSAFAGDAASEAAVRSVLGRAYAAFGEIEPAAEQLARAVEIYEETPPPSPAERYETHWAYANVLEQSATREAWRTQWRRVWRMLPELFEPVAPPLADRMRRITPEQLDTGGAALAPAFEEILVLASDSLSPDAPEWRFLADYLHLGAARMESRSTTAVAATLLTEALRIQRSRLAPANVRVVRTVNALIANLLETGRAAEAEALVRESIAALRGTLPADHWFVALNESQLGACLARQGRLGEAESLMADALTRVEAARGPDSAAAIEVAVRLAELYEAAGRAEDAVRSRGSIAERMARTKGLEVVFRLPWALAPQHAPLAEALTALREADAARTRDLAPVVQEVLRQRRLLVTEDEPLAALVAEYLWFYGKAYANRFGMSDDTLTLFEEAHLLASASSVMRPEKRGTVAWWLAYQYERRQEFAQAEPLARSALEIFNQPPVNPRLPPLGASLLGGCLSGLERYQEAEPLLIDGFQGTLKMQGPRGGDTDVTLGRLLRHFRAMDRAGEAAPFVRATMDVPYARLDYMLQMVEVDSPELADRLRDLREIRSDDRATLVRAISEVIALRRATLELSHPNAAFYADALLGILLNAPAAGRGLHRDLWLPVTEEVLTVYTVLHGPEHLKTTYAQWWHAAALMDRGEYAECLAIAQAGHETRLTKLAAGFPGAYTRFEHLIAGSARMLGELPEPDTALPAVYARTVEMRGHRSIHAIAAFGHVVRMFADRGEPERVAEFALPVLHEAARESRDATELLVLAVGIVRHPGLSEETYQAARAVAERARSLRPADRDAEAVGRLAQLRCGDAEGAAHSCFDEKRTNTATALQTLICRLAARTGETTPAWQGGPQLASAWEVEVAQFSELLRALDAELGDP